MTVIVETTTDQQSSKLHHPADCHGAAFAQGDLT
jgi:hypothetical protein